jgi:hypothetical protein
MIYSYITLADNTEIVHTQVFEQDGVECVEVHFERVTDNGFESARCLLPFYKWILRDGFTDAEIADFEELLRYNAHLIFKFAKTGGVCCA